jgi:hypothetical protein
MHDYIIHMTESVVSSLISCFNDGELHIYCSKREGKEDLFEEFFWRPLTD